MLLPLVTIIIPVYNTEKYISRCLDSIINQTYKNFECIIINDGSIDNSLKICNEYANNDSRILIINQVNYGSAIARDNGIKHAKGEFITFVDSDDWLELYAIELLLINQQKINADIVIANYRMIRHNSITENNNLMPGKYLLSNPLIYFFLYGYNSLCGKLFLTSLFKNYIIPDFKIGEDAYVNIQIFSKTTMEKIIIIKNIIYNYDRRIQGSATNKIIEKSYINNPHITFRFLIEKYLIETNQDKDVLSAFSYYIITPFIKYLKNKNNIYSTNEIKFLYKKYFNKCNHLLKLSDKILLYFFYNSIFLGKLFLKINKFIDIYINILKKINTNGYIYTLQYYKGKILNYGNSKNFNNSTCL